jgi:hypothetical protein
MATASPPTASGVDPRIILLSKKEADLSGPTDHRAFVRSTPPVSIPARDRSIYSPAPPSREVVPLGMGYVQAVLSVLHGLVTTYSYDLPGLAGRLVMRSLSRDTSLYNFSWNEGPDGLVMGGFTHSGQPSYHAAVVELVELDALFRCGESQQSQEVVTRWYELVGAMESAFPRTDATLGWDRRTIERACTTVPLQAHIMRVCDALRIALDYILPVKGARSVGVIYAEAVGVGEGSSVSLAGSALLDHTYVPVPGTSVITSPPAHAPRPVVVIPSAIPPAVSPTGAPSVVGSGTASAPPAGAVLPSTAAPPASAPPATPVSPASSAGVTTPAGPHLGPHYARIRMAVLRGEGQPIMLEGPTGVGKTLLALDVLLESDWGIELLTLHPAWKEEHLFGSYVRLGDDDWRLVPGPLTRFATRVMRGERVCLVMDELGRAEDTIRDLLIDLTNVHSKPTLLAMNSEHVDPVLIPDGEEGPFYLMNSPMTQNRLALPTRRVRIIATANQGERYQGAEFNDDAFFRRFPNWLYLKKYEDDITRSILASHLGLPASAELIKQILVVERQVVALQKAEDCLRTLLYLPTLINWGKNTLWFFHDAASSVRGDLGEAFLQGACDTWLHQACRYEGADLDPDVENKLLGYVRSATPAKID